MRIRWRGLELPSRVIRDEAVSNETYGRFVIEPFEQGFGTTIGNSLRRILLSSLEGAAVTSVKIEGVSHEFSTIEGILEDVTDILLNIKGIIISMDDVDVKTMTLRVDTAGVVNSGHIVTDPAVVVFDHDHHIATLTTNVPFNVEMTVRSGRGYATAADNRSADQEIGVIPMDSIFSPILRVRYRTEAMRVGQRTNYDRLILEVWTKGTVRPEEALVEAGMILRKHLNPFVMTPELGSDTVMNVQSEPSQINLETSSPEDHLDRSVSVLNLSVRANNCLEASGVSTLRELITQTESDLLRFRSFGKTSLHEVQRKLVDIGLSLGMNTEDIGTPVDFGSSFHSTAPDSVASDSMIPDSVTPDTVASETVASDSVVDSPGTIPSSDQEKNPSVPSGDGPMEVFSMGD